MFSPKLQLQLLLRIPVVLLMLFLLLNIINFCRIVQLQLLSLYKSKLFLQKCNFSSKVGSWKCLKVEKIGWNQDQKQLSDSSKLLKTQKLLHQFSRCRVFVPHLLSLTETDLSVVRVNTSALRNEAFWVPLRMFERVCLQRLLHVVSPRFTPL